ncbi:hypothetical protein JZ751_007347, partial [Albula glossodonta]
MADMSVLLCDVVVVLAWDSALVLAVESPAHSHEQKQGRGEDGFSLEHLRAGAGLWEPWSSICVQAIQTTLRPAPVALSIAFCTMASIKVHNIVVFM